jgi:hypothetical protein
MRTLICSTAIVATFVCSAVAHAQTAVSGTTSSSSASADAATRTNYSWFNGHWWDYDAANQMWLMWNGSVWLKPSLNGFYQGTNGWVTPPSPSQGYVAGGASSTTAMNQGNTTVVPVTVAPYAEPLPYASGYRGTGNYAPLPYNGNPNSGNRYTGGYADRPYVGSRVQDMRASVGARVYDRVGGTWMGGTMSDVITYGVRGRLR